MVFAQPEAQVVPVSLQAPSRPRKGIRIAVFRRIQRIGDVANVNVEGSTPFARFLPTRHFIVPGRLFSGHHLHNSLNFSNFGRLATDHEFHDGRGLADVGCASRCQIEPPSDRISGAPFGPVSPASLPTIQGT